MSVSTDLERRLEDLERQVADKDLALRIARREARALQKRTFELADELAKHRGDADEVRALLREYVGRTIPAILEAEAAPAEELLARVWREVNR